MPVRELMAMKNKFDVVGMLGNVWELVEDCKNPNHA